MKVGVKKARRREKVCKLEEFYFIKIRRPPRSKLNSSSAGSDGYKGQHANSGRSRHAGLIRWLAVNVATCMVHLTDLISGWASKILSLREDLISGRASKAIPKGSQRDPFGTYGSIPPFLKGSNFKVSDSFGGPPNI